MMERQVFAINDHDILQIEMAARGCVSGTLAEWPHLMGALRRAGFDLPAKTEAWRLRDLSRQILEAHQEAA